MLLVFKEQRFQNMSIQQLQNWEIKLHFSRKLRASPAQAKKCIWVKKGRGPHNRWSLPWKESSQNTRGICSTSSSDSSDWKKSAQVHCCRKIEALVFLLANSMIVRQGMFFNYEKRRHARKCVIWPILGTSFSTNRHMSKKNPKTGLSGLVLLGIVLETNWGCRYFKQKHKLCFLSFASLNSFFGDISGWSFLLGVFMETPKVQDTMQIVVPLWRHALRSPHRVAGAKTAFWLFGFLEGAKKLEAFWKNMIQNTPPRFNIAPKNSQSQKGN